MQSVTQLSQGPVQINPQLGNSVEGESVVGYSKTEQVLKVVELLDLPSSP